MHNDRRFTIGAILLLICISYFTLPAAPQEPIESLAQEVRSKGWLIYCARSGQGDWDLFLCRPDGSQQTNITNTPDYNEAAPQWSRDGIRLLYRRLRKEENIDGNRYGQQGELVLADGDGTHPQVMGKEGEFPWASWSLDGKRIACLTVKGIDLVDVESKEIVAHRERKGFFQQTAWSPDGHWLCGVANNFGTGWSVARMEIATESVNPISRVDSCTPDWFPDSQNIIFSNRPEGQKGNNGYGWTQLWRADAEGKERRLVYGEDGRHVYGGCISPDGMYVLFTGNMKEDGDPGNQGSSMGLMRLADAPIIGGESRDLRHLHPQAKNGPVLVLPAGWEPSWTYTEVLAEQTSSEAPAAASSSEALAQELHGKGWIAYAGETEAGDWDLFLIRPDGSERRNITQTPETNEGGVRFSPDNKRMLFYRFPKTVPMDNNTYGNYSLVMANADGAQPEVFGDTYHWAAWGPDSRRIACLDKKGVMIVDLVDKKVLQTLPRKGFVQQLGWSTDGQWLCGTANGLGPYWNIGRMNLQTGNINLVSEAERYNCTPDWFPLTPQIIYSRGIVPNQDGRAELWVADGDGQNRRMLAADETRHIYGGALSPDGRYLLFTRSEGDLGLLQNSHTRLAVARLTDTPLIGLDSAHLHNQYPHAKTGPILDLGPGWEPCWTYSELIQSP